MAKSEFDEFVQNDVKKKKGVYMPVQASLAERLTTRHLPIKNYILILMMNLLFLI